MAVDSTSGVNSTATTTSRGTKIVKNAGELDKNSFLKILTAELANQDPDNAKDSTEYVAQMAQFSSLEQMSNLNANITMSSANSMIGKDVVLSDLDSNGNSITGLLKAVSKQGSNVKVEVQVNNNGKPEVDEYSFDDITGVYDADSQANTQANANEMSLLTGAAMIGKHAEFNVQDASKNNYKGVISGVTNNNGVYALSVVLDSTGETKTLSMDNVINLTDVK